MRGCHDLAYLDATRLSLDQVQVRLQLDGPRLPERNKDNSEPHWADSQQDEESLSARAALLQLKAALRTHKKHRTFCIANRSALSERVPQGNLSQFNSLDLALPWFVARRSIQLSYGRADTLFTFNSLGQFLARFQPRVSPHSHPINSKWLSKNCLHVRASSAAARRS